MQKKPRLFLPLWMAGLPGVVAVAYTLVPALAAGQDMEAPLWLLMLASAIQSALLLAFAIWVGAKYAPPVGLHAPFLEALSSSQPALVKLRPQLVPALLAAVFGGVLLVAFARFAPHQIAVLQGEVALPMFARVLYGGVTEELLLRWGLMSFLTWLLWRLVQRGMGVPRASLFVIAIILSALLFGIGHLPAVAALVGEPGWPVIAYVVVGNAAFGMVAGYLFWRYGLEAAIIAHALTHVFAGTAGY